MKHLSLVFALGVIACSSTQTIAHDDGTTIPGSDGGTTTTPGVTLDPDDDSGPEWDGALPSTPTLIQSHVVTYAITADDQIVYSVKGAGVAAMPAQGGAVTTVDANDSVAITRAGRAALLTKSADGSLSAWSKATGARAVPDVEIDSQETLGAYDTASGDFALVVSSYGRAWFFDASAMTMTPLPGQGAQCRATGETLGCAQGKNVLTVDKSGVKNIATASADVVLPPFVVNGDVFYSDGASAYRNGAMFFEGATEIAALQDNWLALTAADGVHVMKADGSEAKLVAAGAHLASYGTSPPDGHDWARVRWVGVCDGEANLRVYDPASERLVPLSKTGCDLRAITYSDNFAFFIDGAAYVNQPVVQEAGTPTVVDLRDGSSRGNPTAMDRFFDHNALPVGKSRLLFTWLAFSTLTYGEYFDGHSPASMAAAQYESPVDAFEGFRLLAGNRGVILPSGGAEGAEYGLYYAPLP